MATLTFTATLETSTCGTCGIQYAAPAEFWRECRRLGQQKTHYCPNGHPWVFSENTETKLKRELLQAQQQLDQQKAETEHQRKMRQAAERGISAQKAVVTKLKKKAAQGACPCCEKLFPDLAGHMATEHPDFEGREEPEVGEQPK